MKLRDSILTFCFLTFCSVNLWAQDDISELFKAGAADLQTVAEGYIKPLGTGFSNGLGNNLYNTAAVHKTWGFDITVGASALFVPSSDQSFSLGGLDALHAVNGEISAPSFAGSGEGVDLQLVKNGQVITEFTTPEGISSIIPTVNAQITIGLPLGNDLSVRYTPTVKTDDFEVGLWGIAIKHNIKQWIPKFKDLPFDASVMVGYTQLNFDYAFPTSITPDDLADDPNILNVPAGYSYEDQGMKMTSSALTANLIVSKKLSFFTPYLGVGVIKSKFDFNFTGNYPTLGDQDPSTGKIQVDVLNNPIPISYSNCMVGATAGFRLKILWVLALHAQYTLQKYPTASVGFGINIR